MEDELSQLDQLIESDILDALGEENPNEDNSSEIDVGDAVEEALELMGCADEDIELQEMKSKEKEINIIDASSNDLASLLSQLLNNKTIEITIKIKD
jgi:hypothetical protein